LTSKPRATSPGLRLSGCMVVRGCGFVRDLGGREYLPRSQIINGSLPEDGEPGRRQCYRLRRRAPPIPPRPPWRGRVGNLAARRQPAPPGFFCPLGRGRSRDDGGAAVAFTLAVLLNHAHVAKWRMRRSTNPGGGGSTPPVRAILLHYAILTLHFATVYVT